MNTQLLTRLERLENQVVSDDKDGLTIFIVPMTADNGKPAANQPEPIGASQMGRDWQLNREPGEAEDAFLERASATVPRGSGGVAVLILTYPEDE